MPKKAEQHVLTKRAIAEKAAGISCYEFQAMLVVDHTAWQDFVPAMDQIERAGAGYSDDEAELATQLINRWIREVGVDEVRKTLTFMIEDRKERDRTERLEIASCIPA